MKGPAVTHIEELHDISDKGRSHGRAVILCTLHKHRGRTGVRLDVVHVVTQALKANQVLHRDKDDAGDRHLAHRAQHNNFLLVGKVHT